MIQEDYPPVVGDLNGVSAEDAGLSCEPDLTVVSWEAFDAGRVRLAPRSGGTDYLEIVGSPDLVVEIVSDSSVRKDTRRLRAAYGRADVREYWLIDARGAELSFEIVVNAAHPLESSIAPSEPQVSGVLGGRWTLTRRRNRAGRFDYHLVQVPA